MRRLWPWVRYRPALFAAVLALGINFQGFWIPSFWYDEVFTLFAISQPLDELLAFTTTQVDAVHLAYYLFMWVWTSVFGLSELAVRLPSVIAVAVAAYFTSLVAERMFGRRVIALASGAILAALPMTVTVTTWARSYALQAAVFAALLWAFMKALDGFEEGHWRKGSAGRWVLVAVLLVTLIHLTIYATLLIPVFAVWMTRFVRSSNLRTLLLPGVSLTSAGLVSLPLLLLAVAQRGQIDWTGRPSLESIFFDQLFATNLIAAFIGWALILAGISYALQRQSSSGHRVFVAFLVSTYAFPTAVIALLSWDRLLGQSLYNTKYFHFVTPAMAIVMGLGVHLMTRHTSPRAKITAGLIVLALIGPSLERSPKGRDGDWPAGIAAIQASEIEQAGYWFANDHTSSMLYVYGDKLAHFSDLTRTSEPTSGLVSEVLPLEVALATARETGQSLIVGYRIVNRQKIDAALRDLDVTDIEEIYTDGRLEIVLVR